MKYCSTRGKVKGLSFSDAVMMGLADDGGLLLPEEIPTYSANELAELGELSYPDLAFRVISRFVDDIPAADLKKLIDTAYSSFEHPDTTPIVKQDGIYILELFHGPTLAFKDVALQFLGNLFEYLLDKSGCRMNIIGATSGDTGSAAIYGVRGRKNINIFILHPKGRVSPIQELQMTTVTDENVFNLAVEGTFDDAQSIVKEIFGDLDFKEKHALGAVNSINWARVLAQVVYYFYAWFQVNKETGCKEIEVSVPTGNFGDIFAGYVAKEMGVPIKRLILATNANSILSRFVNDGDYSAAEVHQSLSPSMDIQVASNFERYLFYLYGKDSEAVCKAMDDFKKSGILNFTDEQLQQVQSTFTASAVNDEETIEAIAKFHKETGYTLDPHTAVGVEAGCRTRDKNLPLVCLSTAHPAKFGSAVKSAIGQDPELPTVFQGIEKKPKKLEVIAAKTEEIKAFVEKHAR
ncbi:L-threonine synthase [Malonomonas rubra DSM 5091]|uniref:Threonine synthase n=1 Tax=Malonomonas rubra DSM 5091 TaxID=1122189 RepID=A0A1M6B5E9_MALRU|nr:threonine synthase [Malonomonas rubra]SHI43984.1 L-threonine synthase [Malonomonas rubra DSM 5091]